MTRTFEPKSLNLDGKAILVTGGTGSFGKAFIRRILKDFNPRRIIVYSRDELKQFEMAQEFSSEEYPALRYFIGDVRDRDRLVLAMRGVDYVIHAAAMKQVPTAEYNPMECVNTNIIGANNLVRAAMDSGVEKVVALSTDKAVNPINLYGASKLAADKIFVAANNLSGAEGTRYSVVRYGNVVGSRGSVIPFFMRLIQNGAAELPITDPAMTRFWITLDQGINFVLSSLEMMHGGEIMVPRIPSMKVVDIAKFLAPSLPHKFVGVRPGEKLHEILVSADDSRNTVELDDRYVVEPAFAYWSRSSFASRGGKPIDGNFCYCSDSNDEWLDEDGLRLLLEDSGIEW